MNFKIISNPPFILGHSISEFTLKLGNIGVYLMPLSCLLKSHNAYKQVKSFDFVSYKKDQTHIRVNSKSPNTQFDAFVGTNLAIIEYSKNKQDTIKSFKHLFYLSINPRYKYYYEKNYENEIYKVRKYCKSNSEYVTKNRDKIFLECTRCCGADCGMGFGKNSTYYKYNTRQDDYLSGRFCFFVEFKSKREKENFMKWWYSGRKGKSLSSKLMMGALFQTVGVYHSFLIPQIDWTNIEENEYWKNNDYDTAVMSELGLIYNAEKDIIEKIK